MASIEERLQIKREPLDKWSIREQLCLAVARNTDQNLTSVSRVLKPFGEPNRPPDWFTQKNCAAQYGALLANFETPKRKKRTSSAEVIIETPAEAILRKLLSDRQAELKKLLSEEKAEYQQLQKDLHLLNSGNVSEEQLDAWCREIDEEEQKKEQEQAAFEQWLREREQRKLEIERAWRPAKPAPMPKRKSSESHEVVPMELEPSDDPPKPDTPKPALSPLLTSLLKSPSQNPATSSILHSAITNQRPTTTNPTIASLLSSSTNVAASPGIQQLVSTAITQETQAAESRLQVLEEPADVPVEEDSSTPADILDDPSLQILKIDDLASSILIENGPLPEMKNDVDVIISDLIDNAHDIVADPEQHLQLDGNGDININLELDDFDEEEENEPEVELEPEAKPEIETVEETAKDDVEVYDKQIPSVDPFEFQDEPEEFTPKPCTSKPDYKSSIKESQTPSPLIVEETEPEKEEEEEEDEEVEELEEEIKEDQIEEIIEKSPVLSPELELESEETVPGDVEDEKEPEKSPESEKVDEEGEIEEDKGEEAAEFNVFDESSPKSDPKSADSPLLEVKKEPDDDASDSKNADFNEELYDDVSMEVKIDKTGKAKRDYSRTKKKEEKDFDLLISLDKVTESEENFSDHSETEKKEPKSRVKPENDRSSSPWTEEEDASAVRARRRQSTSATPVDSVPSSPVSSIFYIDDDREHKSWKKSVMLVYNRLQTHKYASLFTKPITNEQAPGYHSRVYRPMDLSTIRKNIESGVVRTTQHFQRDVLLMLNNAIMYNKTNDTVYNMARQMQQESMQQIQILLQAQSQGDAPPARRETRTSEPGLKRKRALDESTSGNRSKKRKDD